MSRCFPFPPPGYAGKSNNEALIFSIELQRENEKAISDRAVEEVKSSDKKKDKSSEKDRKKEKKDKKRDKVKLQSAVACEKQMCIEKLYKAEKQLSETKGKQVLHQCSSELLERSNLTEEHGRPVESQNASCSSDSTSNSSKRKRYPSSANTIQRSGGNILRIRLSSSCRRDEPSTSGSKVQLPSQNSDDRQSYGTVRPCSNILRIESPIKQTEVMLRDQVPSCHVSTSTATMQLVASKDEKQINSLQEKKIDSLPQTEHPSSTAKHSMDLMKKICSHEKKMRKRESLYNSLFENLSPPTFEVNQVDNEDWLFGRKDEEAPAKRLKATEASQGCVDNLPCSASAALQPRAHLLTDVGIYALPFTVPF